MADEKTTQSLQDSEKATAPAPAKKKAKKPSRIAKWFREMRSELKKVIWPTRKQTVNNTIVALVVMLIAAIVIWGFDQIAAQGVRALISLGG